MIYPARLAVPTSEPDLFHHAVIDRAVEGPLTVFASPPGYFLTDSLASTLRSHGRSVLWLRAEVGDRDPAAFLISLVSATRQVSPGFGSATLEEMRGKPGPIFGWPPLFSRLGQEMANELPRETAVVFEDIHLLEHTHPTLQLLANHLLPVLPSCFAIILISDRKLPAVRFPTRMVIRDLGDLRLDPASGSKIARESGADLSPEWIRLAIHLTEGRAVALAGLFSATLALGPAIIQQVLKRSKNYLELFSQIAKVYFSWAEPASIQALSIVARLIYSHPHLVKEVLHGRPPLGGPWFQPLSDDWIRLRRFWNAPIQAVLSHKEKANKTTLQRASAYLASNNATGPAIRLFSDNGDLANVSKVITEEAETLLNTGQWITLKEWLNLIPSQVLFNLPKLALIQGELAAAEGRIQLALSDFSQAASIFSAKNENSGACHSLLAEATLSSWIGDSERAQARCLSARAIAEAYDLRWYKGWSELQLGSISAAAGKLDEALIYFGQASVNLQDGHLENYIGNAKSLVERQRASREKRIHYFREYLNAQKDEQEAGKNLEQLLGSPVPNLDTFLETWGWFNTPLAIKLSAPLLQSQGSKLPFGTSQGGHFFQKILNRLVATRRISDLLSNSQQRDHQHFQDTTSYGLVENSRLGNTDSVEVSNHPIVTILTGENIPLGDTAILSVSSVSPATDYKTTDLHDPTPTYDPTDSLFITAHLFGKFRISVNNQPIHTWPSGRANTVIKYLLLHHDRRVPRDMLMDVFWPDATPGAARNSLNVTLHSLRQVFRKITEEPIILFDNGAYALNPEIKLWIDVNEFERHLRSSQKLEAAGNLTEAMKELEFAASLYQGDFLEDNPYEDWAVFTRERTRLDYLDLLDHLNRIYFDQGHYTACASLCQIILNHDNCREDAHRRLMRCYCHMGKRHLALRQFQICVEALKNDLDIDPEPETVQLVTRIRSQEVV